MPNVNRFLGDTPFRVFLKLLIVSFLVGVVMSAFGWSPADVLNWLRRSILHIWELGFDTIYNFIEYLALGAAIVIPVFLVLRLLSYRK